MKKLIYCLLCYAILLFGSCQPDKPTPPPPSGQVNMVFDLQVGEKPLVMNQASYKNDLGTSYQIEKFAFYVSNITLRNAVTQTLYVIPNSYHLINFNDNKLQINLIGLPPATYDQLNFAVGVDEKRNTSIDQVGDLDPNNGMAWDWKTGYKFLSLEGKYFPSQDNVRGLVFHIGTAENYKTISLPLTNFVVKENETLRCKLPTDLNKLFSGVHSIDFTKSNSVMGGEDAKKVAQNYAKMFQLVVVP